MNQKQQLQNLTVKQKINVASNLTAIVEVENKIQELYVFLEVADDDDDMEEKDKDNIKNEINFNILKLTVLKNEDIFLNSNRFNHTSAQMKQEWEKIKYLQRIIRVMLKQNKNIDLDNKFVQLFNSVQYFSTSQELKLLEYEGDTQKEVPPILKVVVEGQPDLTEEEIHQFINCQYQNEN